MGSKRWLSIQDFSDHVGVGYEHVRRSIRRGRIPKAALRKNRSKRNRQEINLEEGLSAFDENFAPENRKRKTPKDIPAEKKRNAIEAAETGGMTYDQARRLNEQYKAALKKLEYDRLRGSFILAEKVKKDGDTIGRLIKEHVKAIPGRISALVAGESDPHKCEQILILELNRMLQDMSDAIIKSIE